MNILPENTPWVPRPQAASPAAAAQTAPRDTVSENPVQEGSEPLPEDSVIIRDGEAASIGIIGGADGPTAIFVTGSPGGFAALAVTAAILIGAIFLIFKKRKRHK